MELALNPRFTITKQTEINGMIPLLRYFFQGEDVTQQQLDSIDMRQLIHNFGGREAEIVKIAFSIEKYDFVTPWMAVMRTERDVESARKKMQERQEKMQQQQQQQNNRKKRRNRYDDDDVMMAMDHNDDGDVTELVSEVTQVHFLNRIDFEFKYSGDRILKVKHKAHYVSMDPNEEKNAYRIPEKIQLSYMWEEVPAKDATAGLTLLYLVSFVGGLAVLVLVMRDLL